MALDDEPWHPPEEGFYMTDAFTDHAVNLLDDYARRADPFLLYLAYTAARQRNQFNVNNPTGRFTFQPQLTSNCAGIATGCSVNSNTGFSVASFCSDMPVDSLAIIVRESPGSGNTSWAPSSRTTGKYHNDSR